MTPALWQFGLTPDQAMKIAMVSLNWSAVDMSLGMALVGHTGIVSPLHAADLVHILDVRTKIDILHRRYKRGEFHSAATVFIKEMVWIGENYRADRNMLAHAVYADDGADGVMWSPSKLKALALSELDAIVSEARYAAHIANRLSLAIHGIELPEAPPPRPAARP